MSKEWLQHEELVSLENFFHPLHHKHYGVNTVIRTGISTWRPKTTVCTVFTMRGEPFAVHVLHPLSLITRASGAQMDKLFLSYQALADEITSFLTSHHTVKADRRCPCCEQDSLVMFVNFYGNKSALVGMGCRRLPDVIYRPKVGSRLYSTTYDCPFYYSLKTPSDSLTVYTGRHYKAGKGQTLLRTWANFLLGITDCIRQAREGDK